MLKECYEQKARKAAKKRNAKLQVSTSIVTKVVKEIECVETIVDVDEVFPYEEVVDTFLFATTFEKKRR